MLLSIVWKIVMKKIVSHAASGTRKIKFNIKINGKCIYAIEAMLTTCIGSQRRHLCTRHEMHSVVLQIAYIVPKPFGGVIAARHFSFFRMREWMAMNDGKYYTLKEEE